MAQDGARSDGGATAAKTGAPRPPWADAVEADPRRDAEYGRVRRSDDDPAIRDVGFLIVDDFPLLALSGAVDVLRQGNRYAALSMAAASGGAPPRYRTTMFSVDGAPTRASNGLEIRAERPISAAADAGLWKLFVVSGFHPERVADDLVLAALRKLARQGVGLGGVSAGAFVLARAGLMEGRRCAVHFEYAAAFAEMWPAAVLSDALYVVDGDRMSCAGGSATIDMFLRLISDVSGPEVAARAAEQMLVDRVRSTVDRQTSAALFRAKARSPALAKAIEAMEGYIDAPLSMIEIAALVGLTRRQLHRLFREHTGAAPTDFYRDLRLRHARNLLKRTPAKVIDVALASGFGSHSHFSKVYREHFGVSPLQDRREDM